MGSPVGRLPPCPTPALSSPPLSSSCWPHPHRRSPPPVGPDRLRACREQLKVVSISDGDTFTGLDSQNRQIKVRLHGIDAPEKAQAFGNVSRKALGDLIEGKTVEVQQVDKDRYGRVVANVHVGGVHVNRELVAKGLAWRYVQYDKKGEFTEAEQAAKTARKGLRMPPGG